MEAVSTASASNSQASQGTDSGKTATAIRRSRSMPVPEDKEHGKSLASMPTLRKGRTSQGRRNAISSAGKPNAAAGAGPSAPRTRKRVPPSSKKMALPFTYGSNDPRNHHIEIMDGLPCHVFIQP